MIENRGLPPYPPAQKAWTYPPPPISRRWLWAPIAVTVLGLLAAAGLAVSAYAISTKDYPSLIDDDQLVAVITRECKTMISTIDSMPVTGSAKQQTAILEDQNAAVRHMLRVIRKVDKGVRQRDKPTNAWLQDWERLIEAREGFAELVSQGYQPNLRIPRDSAGDRISLRMDDVWLADSACKVPKDLLNPYPKDLSDI